MSACRDLGWIGELIGFLLLAARVLYVQWKNRQIKTENKSLTATVQQLSLRPPAPVPVTLQLAPHPSLAELVPTSIQPAPSPRPSLAGEPSDPDHVDPPRSDRP